ncbi:DNA-binding transcriptional regulator Fis [Mangrovimicrobium sediminis]|uniref:Putative Fis-like DNA-binding protein n=1 Tax=Mangrovimicrobium sediminis TaxID=2562682 RepID=A0A4Z0LYU1_9GAMM|nr:DNA-binding transcriptional regulator Fis [Haliea sp. SAOS-164]TGD72459.1 DNA-binding transcriptional regulator Fis [Haliea sp. SAOS-164]
MTRAEPIPSVDGSAANDDTLAGGDIASLRDSVRSAVQKYLNDLDGQLSTDVYQMVLAEVEAPLLEEVMAYTRHNQTKASIMLGLNRGTLRKKLKQYNLIGKKG